MTTIPSSARSLGRDLSIRYPSGIMDDVSRPSTGRYPTFSESRVSYARSSRLYPKWENYEVLDDPTPTVTRGDSFPLSITKFIARDVVCRCQVSFAKNQTIILSSESGRFLMSARRLLKSRSSYFAITGDADGDTDVKNPLYLGKLRANFVGSEYSLYTPGNDPKELTPPFRSEILAIRYMNKLIRRTSKKGPRTLTVCLKSIDNPIRTYDSDALIKAARQSGPSEIHSGIESYSNVPPCWDESTKAYTLSFPSDRVRMASVKNLVLSQLGDPETTPVLMFGKLSDTTFVLDFSFPFSPLQAFAVALSSVDFKLCSK